LLKEDSLYVNKSFFGADLEKGIDKVRGEFRARHSINPNGTVVFFAPGNEKVEAEFCMETVRKGVKEFILKYSSPTSLSPKAPPVDHFTTIISVHKGSEAEQFIKDFINEKGWHGRVILVNNENNEHIDAMAASDMGLAYDG
jgi:hypothetical protein